MSKRAQDNLVAVIGIAILAGFLVASFNYGFRARMVPVPIAVISIFLLLAQLILQNTRYGTHLNVDPADFFKPTDPSAEGDDASAITAETAVAEPHQAGEVRVSKKSSGSEWTAMGMVVAFPVLVWLVGIMPSMFLFVVSYFVLTRRRWYWALLWGGAVEISLYLMFVRVLKVQINPGWIEMMLNK